ncbi:protein spaetzle 4-like isoform X2 [Dermacentor silvarum]|uniref:protein spaetzle 4-like isoform X2 n=1 Tax=Dermacentor silvarum TaxID=543639 RepID=UPI001898CD7B|nr:protein spaetzle 4-like isoform X2 [Dermacentor silvarum]
MENYCSFPWSTSAVLRRFHWHVLLLALGVSVLWQQEQRGGRTGGAADAQSCGPRISARFLLDIPCDMTRSAFCNVAGSSYPWHAVRRYIFENQGLVRRMYGDQRHSVIVGTEIEARRMRYDDLRFHEPESPVPPVSSVHRTRGRAAYRVRPNSRYANLLKTSPLADGEKARPPPPPPPPPPPSLRPPAHADVTVGMATTTTGTSPVPATDATGDSPVTTAPAVLGDDAGAYKPGSPTQVVFHGEPVDVDAPSRLATETPHNQEPGAILTTPTAPTHTPAAAATTREHLSTDTLATTTTEAADFEPSYAAGEPFTHEPEPLHAYATSQASTAASQPLFSLLDSNSIEAPDRDDAPHNHGRPATAAASVNHPDEDAEEDASTEQPPPPPAEPLRRGVNACPVKQEVLAPYWANNTRGKVLALLNVYPFEQYVHAEKCAFENQQMFCRDGCRCEQQFRLHRLLAFDPRNECRGIFADWFRFPSCCVCICYDLGSPASRWMSSGRDT